MVSIISAKICGQCGGCCRHHPFVRLSKNEVSALKHATGLDSEVFADSRDTTVDEYFLQFKENGDCFFLIEHNGSYSCGAYAARPAICRSYPSEARQHQVCSDNKQQFILVS